MEDRRVEDLPRVALYARVSSQRQAEALTIQSQVAALRERIAADGLHVDEECCFLDVGISGTTLVRPALERLRDAAWAGGVDRLYVHSPDRLARNYAHQVVLLEEFQRHGVTVIFLNHEPSATPEGTLLLQMQGMIAEYERAKILERSRRGRRFAARQGKVSVLSHAPYGYRYVPKHLGGGEARYDVVLEEARVVRDLFTWVGVEGLSLAAVVRRLAERNIPTATGKPKWDKTTVRGILRNPAYQGLAMYGKTRVLPRKPRPRPRRGDPDTPRKEGVGVRTEPAEQQPIAVPAIVGAELFAVVSEQLETNRRRHRQRQQQVFLLSGLLVCQRCGSAYCGQRAYRQRGAPAYIYYRCLGSDRHRFAGEELCTNRGLNGALLEAAVWADVCRLLQDPSRVQQELERRLERPPRQQTDLSQQERTIGGLKRRLTRLLDAYEHGWVEKTELAPRLERVKEQLVREEAALAAARHDEDLVDELKLYVGDFATFAAQIAEGLASADDTTKRDLLRLLIKRIEVGDSEVRIVYKVQPPPFVPSPASRGFLHFRLRRRGAALQISRGFPDMYSRACLLRRSAGSGRLPRR
jgi:site-specific DNA recombinase